MTSQQRPAMHTDIVSGWKDVASYLGKGVRTVQRYERTEGLPVRRSTQMKTGSVLATRADLDAWVNARPFKHTFSLGSEHPGNHLAGIDALRKSLAEQRQLRHELSEMGKVLHKSVDMLRASVSFMQGDTSRGMLLEWRKMN